MRRNNMFTSNELAILKALWGAGEALSRPQILENITDREMNCNTFHFAMNRLIEKGYVEAVGVARCGMNYGRTYLAKKTRGEYLLETFKNMVSEVAKEGGVQELMAAYVERQDLKPETIAELEEMLAKRRRELEEQKAGAAAENKE